MSLKKIGAAILAAYTLSFSFPQLGEKADDFTIYSYDSEENINFNSNCAGKIVCLISGSFCWPPFRQASERRQQLFDKYKNHPNYLQYDVYIWEAHDGETWTSWPEFKDIEEPTNLQERIAIYEMYRNADNVTVPALIDDPDGGGDDPGKWANSSGYDSQPTSIYLIGTDTTFHYLVNFALMGWQMSYNELDAKIQELLDETSNNEVSNKFKTNSNICKIRDNKITISSDEQFSVSIFNLQGKEIINYKKIDEKQIDLPNKFSKGAYLLNIDLESGEQIKRTFLIK